MRSRRVAIAAAFLVLGSSASSGAAERDEELPPLAPRGWGLNVTARAGAIGFLGSLRSFVGAGPLFGVELGYDLASFATIFLAFEGATHPTVGPPPPLSTALQAYYGSAGARLSLHLGAGIRLFAAAFAGVAATSSDVLATWGVPNATRPGAAFGAEVGIDLLAAARHFSVGLAGGFRLTPALGDAAAHGIAYLRYTF